MLRKLHIRALCLCMMLIVAMAASAQQPQITERLNRNRSMVSRLHELGVKVATDSAVKDILVEAGRVKGVRLKSGAIHKADAVILATGTFLGGKIFIGSSVFESGPSGLAAADLLNTLFPEPDGDMALLMENLWHPGLTLTEPEVTGLLLNRVRYQNKGIMLDTGHLMHTDLTLRTQEEALAYIRRRIEEQGEAVRKAIRGIHLNQSLTGDYMASVAAHPPALSRDPQKRMEQVYTHAFSCDRHRPFTCPGVQAFIEWIDPEYLTFEFISRSRAEQEAMLKVQLDALKQA